MENTSETTDNEFEDLKTQIHLKTLELIELQKEHFALTGQNYVISGPREGREGNHGHNRLGSIQTGRY